MQNSIDSTNCIELPFDSENVFADWLIKIEKKDPNVSSFLNGFASLETAKKLISEKKYEASTRKILVEALINQYGSNALSESEKQSLLLLQREDCYTVTTGHQLSFATGELYFILKAVHTIALANDLNRELNVPVVPIFWLADEDHDFNEINHLNFFSTRIGADNLDGNRIPVGAINPNVFNEALSLLEEKWGAQNQELFAEIRLAYKGSESLTQASRKVISVLFGNYGMLALNGNDKNLKQVAKSLFLQELETQFVSSEVNKTSHQLISKNIIPENKLQAKAKNLNFFVFENGKRNKVDIENNEVVTGSGKKYSIEEFKKLVENNPEVISPNVFLRPLYQEFILPNLAYIGGGAEVSYWMQLSSCFEVAHLKMPMLIQRNSVLPIEQKSLEKFINLGFVPKDLLQPLEVLKNSYLKKNVQELSLSAQKESLSLLFATILEEAEKIDKTLMASVEGEKMKALSGINNLEQKLNKALKQKFELQTNVIIRASERLKPQGTLNERIDSGMQYLNKNGIGFIEQLLKIASPWGYSLKIVIIQ